MKIALVEFDSFTISWFRLFTAFVVLVLMSHRKLVGSLHTIRPHGLGLAATGICLGVNYYCFMRGVELGGPITAAITIQIGPVLLALLGVLMFRERLSFVQLLGVMIAAIGFSMFFHDRMSFASGGFQFDAIIMVAISALFWVGFCIGQKILGAHAGVNMVNLAAYLSASLILLPFIVFPESDQLLTTSFIAMLYLSLSTVVAYWALGEAIRLIPVSIVSVCIITNPIVTVLVVEIFRWSGNEFFEPHPLSGRGYLGTAIALIGVMATVLKWSAIRASLKPSTHIREAR
jgi:drug/metabolite transporter (DMT)-like permease